MAEEQKEVNEQLILDYAAAGLKPAQIAERIGGGITPQKVGVIIKAHAKPEDDEGDKKKKPKGIDKVDVLGKGPQVMSAPDYMEYSKKNGRTAFGGKKGEKIKCSVEELRAYINASWKPSMVMEKYQLDEDEFKSLVFNLSKKELRDVPIKYSLKQDLFY
jgi:hypothetical protein